MKGTIWTKDEIEYLTNNWNKVSMRQLTLYLHKGEPSIRLYAEEHNFPPYKSNRWTDEEELYLKENADKYTVEELAIKLRKTKASVDHKIQKMKLKTITTKKLEERWNEETDEYIRLNLNKISLSQMEKELNTNYYSLIKHIEEIGLVYDPNRWTDEETNILITEGPNHTLSDMEELIPTRSKGAISAKAHDLGIELVIRYTYLTNEQLEYLKSNWGIKPQTEIARDLHVGMGVINRYKNELNLPNHGQLAKKNNDIVEQMKKDAETLTRDELALKYDLCPTTISKYAKEYGFKLIDSKNKWTYQDIEKLRELQKDKKTLKEMSSILNKTSTSIRRKLIELGLSINYDDWTKEEDSLLVDICKKYNDLSDRYQFLHVVATELGSRNEYQVENRLIRMKYPMPGNNKPFTDEQKEEILKIAPRLTPLELMRKYKRSSNYIINLLRRNNVYFKTDYNRKWTEEEIEKLIELSKTHTLVEISEILNRSYDAVSLKLNRLNHTLSNNWTEEQINTLKKMWNNYTIYEIAETIGRTESAVKNKAWVLGLHIDNSFEADEDGLLISELETIFKIPRQTINVQWISLGLKTTVSYYSNKKKYQYVKMKDLLEFLKKYPTIWNASYIDKEILKVLPKWIRDKAKEDRKSERRFNLTRLNKEERIKLLGEDTYNYSKKRVKKNN